MPTPFGPRLRQLRRAAGLTLEVVAERMGRRKQLVWTLEQRSTPPTIETTQALARALGIDPSELDPRLAPAARAPGPNP